MSNGLVNIEIHNFRSIANLKLELNSLNVLFGPNGVGKSSFLDTLLFLSDCINRDINEAAARRNQGVGLLWDGASKGDSIKIKLETMAVIYETEFEFSSGRISGNVREHLSFETNNISFRTYNEILIDRNAGDPQAKFYDPFKNELQSRVLDSWKMALSIYVALFPMLPEPSAINNLLKSLRFYLTREADLDTLKRSGSQSSHHTTLLERCQNLWSALRNLHDRRVLDDRYETIMRFMQKSFPSFKALLIEQIGPSAVYANMIEEGRRQSIPASGISDGHLQMLINLTALFAEEKGKTSLILFDEPETSLHPHAIAKFAEAAKLATQEWGRQVFIATHSPVLLSQFEPENILAVGMGEQGETKVQRVSEIKEVKDLLEDYALGSLYMAEAIAPQSKHHVEVE